MAGSYAAGGTWRDKKSQSVPCSATFEVPKDKSLYFFVTTVKIKSCMFASFVYVV